MSLVDPLIQTPLQWIGKNWYLLYKYRRGHFDRMLRNYLAQWRLEQLPIPVQSITVDLIAGRPVRRNRGDAVDAILESINLPVFSKPIYRDGQALVDGGLVDNVPADVLVRRGCNFVIAVSVTSALEAEFAKNNSATPTAKMRSASTLQTVLRSYLVQHVNMNSVGVEPADFVIEPDVTGVDLSDFSRTRDLADVGHRAALDAIKPLKSLLSKLDDRLFSTT